jgi:hypothetical protein
VDSPSADKDDPTNDTPKHEKPKPTKKAKAAAKHTAKDHQHADVAKTERQAKEIVALGARVLEKVRVVTTDPAIVGKEWASPMIASVKQRTDEMQQRIKDNPHSILEVLHAVMLI